MRTLPILLACLAATSMAANYKLVWSDEFDYKGLPDPGKWNYAEGGWGWGNNELQYYKPANPRNSYVSDGVLTITVQEEDTTWTRWGTTASNHYSSARLITEGKASWKYGKFEARMKLPRGTGMWPAFWMVPADNVYGGWPKSGEIDILENYGIEPDVVHGSVQTVNNNGTNSVSSLTFANRANDSFHVYGLEWRPDSLFVSLDGQTYFRYGNSGKGSDSWPFDQAFTLILNVAVQASIQGANTSLPQSLDVDWVRVYQDPEISGEIPPPPSFAIELAQTEGGTISVNPAKESYAPGERVTITARPAEGYVFAGWTQGSTSANPEDVLTIQANTTLQARFVPDLPAGDGELLRNGDFSQDWANWTTFKQEGFSPVLTLRDGAGCIRPGKTGTRDWDVQLVQAGLPIVAGKDYAVSFSAKASRKRELVMYLSQGTEPFAALTTQPSLAIDTAFSPYRVVFRALGSAANGRIEFNFGLDSTEICLDDVSVRQVPSSNVRGKSTRSHLDIRRNGRLGLSVTTSSAATWSLRGLHGAAWRAGSFPGAGTHLIPDLPAGWVGLLVLEAEGERSTLPVATL